MKRLETDAFALIATLLMVLIVSMTLMAFIATVASDRSSSNAIYNTTRARLAMEGGVTLGITRLLDHFSEYPDSATAWGTVLDTNGKALVEGTEFYYRANGKISFLPLISGAVSRLLSDTNTPLELAHPDKAYAHPYNSVDLNAARYPGDEMGWIGSPPGGRKAIRVPWVEMTDPADPDQVIARYAYWIEDESFRLNINVAETSASNDLVAALRPEGLSLPALLSSLSLTGSNVDAVKELRAASPGGSLLSLSSLNQLEGLPTLGEDVRFSTTLHSGGLNLSRSGAKRLNLNTIISDSSDATEIRRQLDQIIAAIETQAPDFGQRFYRIHPDLNSAQVSSPHAKIYLQKIAANLRDYIDTDSQPTIVNADGSIRLGRPLAGIEPELGPYWPGGAWATFKGGENSVIAVGKEAVPYLQEFGCRVRLFEFDPASGGKAVERSRFDFTLDYYFEFWNMTSKAIQLGEDAFLRVYNQAGFDTGDGETSIPGGRSIEIAIPSSVVFPPGSVTVLTTDPSPGAWVRNLSAVVTLPVSEDLRRFRGYTYKKTSDNKFRVDLLARSTMKLTSGVAQLLTDYETRMVLGNSQGVLESLCALPLARGVSSSNNALSIHNDNDAINNPDGYFYRGGSLVGTIAGSQVGDPRSNNEQLYFRIYDGNGGENDKEQTRYYNSKLDNGVSNVPAESTLGIQNGNYVNPSAWPDSSPWTTSGINAPMEIADGTMRSIGELGHLYDPARGVGPSGNIAYSRGGGRTLTMGQPDPLWDKKEESASREWAAWRLADIFCIGNETLLDGAINFNGIRRDGGAALRAVLEGFLFQSDPGLDSVALSAESVIAQMIEWLNDRKAPFMERGQLSEALAFGSDWTGTGNPQYDRGREELFRRLIEMSTTRGNVFSVYAIGQAITMTPTGERRVGATSRIKITFRIDPVWDPALNDDFDPDKPAEVAARFRKPDRYRITRLQAAP